MPDDKTAKRRGVLSIRGLHVSRRHRSFPNDIAPLLPCECKLVLRKEALILYCARSWTLRPRFGTCPDNVLNRDKNVRLSFKMSGIEMYGRWGHDVARANLAVSDEA